MVNHLCFFLLSKIRQFVDKLNLIHFIGFAERDGKFELFDEFILKVVFFDDEKIFDILVAYFKL
jgi:hypothetical protein